MNPRTTAAGNTGIGVKSGLNIESIDDETLFGAAHGPDHARMGNDGTKLQFTGQKIKGIGTSSQ